MDMTPVIAIELGFRYDLVAGTSTAAILAIGLGIGLTPQEMLSCDGLIVALGSTPRFGVSAPLRTFARIPSRPALNPGPHESCRFEEPILQERNADSCQWGSNRLWALPS